jgi:tetratricopeptide (TPR) repeat protein
MDPLRAYWDFDDLDASEARFRALRAEALTQLARVEGLRERFDAGDRLLDEAATEADPRVRIRVDLERGRLRRSGGDKEAALPLFVAAFDAARAAGEDWLAADAAHMCALAAPDRDGFVAWTQRGIELAETSEAASYWLGPLLNNLGWEFFDAGKHEQALDAFERALTARERDPDNVAALGHAREAVDEALRALGRPPRSTGR